MAIDTAYKRRSAVCTRRLPWFRRFYPLPDGTIGQRDRQQVAFVYGGILAAAPSADVHLCGNVIVEKAYTGRVTIGPKYEGKLSIEKAYTGRVTINEC